MVVDFFTDNDPGKRSKNVNASTRPVECDPARGEKKETGGGRVGSFKKLTKVGLAAQGTALPIELARAFMRLILFFKHVSFFICSSPLFRVLPAALRGSLIPREQLTRDNVIGMLIGNSSRSRRGRVPKGVDDGIKIADLREALRSRGLLRESFACQN